MSYLSDFEVESKLARSHAAWQKYRDEDPSKRSEILINISSHILNAKDDFSKIIQSEMGKSREEANAEVIKSAEACSYVATHASRWLQSDEVLLQDRRAQVYKYSKGPILCIMPWNYPLWQVVRLAAPALAAGNVVCLKHSELMVKCAEMIESIFQLGCCDSDLLLNFPISHSQTANLIADPRIRGVTFTGSTRGGRQIAELAGKSIKKVVLELGGNDAYLVLSDADVILAAQLCAHSRMLNQGQSCISGKRFFVDSLVYTEFLYHFKLEMQQYCGHGLASEYHKKELEKQVQACLSAGGKMLWQGVTIENEKAYPPTIIEVAAEKIIQSEFDQELFGPVALVCKFSTEQQAIQLANSSQYGLGGAIFSKNQMKAQQIAKELDCGMVAINDFVRSDARLPFGGVKNSGFGYELGYQGFMEFVQLKVVQ